MLNKRCCAADVLDGNGQDYSGDRPAAGQQARSSPRGAAEAVEAGRGGAPAARGRCVPGVHTPLVVTHAQHFQLSRRTCLDMLLCSTNFFRIVSQQGAKPVNAVPAATARDGRKKPGSASSMSRGQTLVIVPTVALRQWQAEILRFTREGALTVSVYHGSSRGELTQVWWVGPCTF